LILNANANLQFQVYGYLETSDGYERFSFHHSYQDDFPTSPQPKYTPSGVFMSFDLYSVEDRNRVKCVSGIEGRKWVILIY
jgi:heparosan-N-sulfate-glucuronate 5-epimerase